MSDSDDDFMSDKFLVETAPSGPKSYTERRHAEQLKSLRKGQAKNAPSLKVLEEERRREGLNTSLFNQAQAQASSSGGAGGSVGAGKGPATAMGMMMKMGWKVGEGLGKKRSASPPESSKRARLDDDGGGGDEDEVPRGGIGSSSRSGGGGGGGRTEPIRISMWAGRRGLAARSPSPPPLPPTSSGRNVDALDPKKLERLGRETEDFRARQRREFRERELERKARAARHKLVEFDTEKGVKYHPLHVLPSDPLGTLPRPLLRLIYPSQVLSPSPGRSPEPEPIKGYDGGKNLSAAEQLREQMRKDMLQELGAQDNIEYGRVSILEDDGGERPRLEAGGKGEEGEAMDHEGINWEGEVSGTKKVLSMDLATYLQFIVSQLRHEYLYCFWCAYRYKSYEEMEGDGGCPGEDEDDH